MFERLLTARGGTHRTVLGMDFSGQIEATGAAVSVFRPGDRVFGMCPRGVSGAQAEYFCMPETGPIAAMPLAIPFDEAVVCEGAYYAYSSVSRFCATPGCEALIYGASGAIGTAAVQLAKHFGAHVTAVVATQHQDMAKSLGADRVIDYTAPEFRTLGKNFDFVLDAVGKMTLFQWRKLVKSDGFFATTDLGPWGQDAPFLLWSAITRSGKVSVPLPRRGSAPYFVNFLKEQMEAGRFRAVIDRKYPLDAIADAYRYVQKGQKTGIVVIDVQAG